MAALLLALAAHAAPQVEADASRVLLGSGTGVHILVRGGGSDVRGVASAGTLSLVGPVDGGGSRFLWTPPEARAPFVAVLAFWEAGHLGLGDASTLTLPCSARTELAIDTEPGARVTVEIGGAHFGPRRADARGKLRMPVEIPPAAHEARITAEIGDQGKVRVVPLAAAISPWVWAVEPPVLLAGSEGHALLIAPEQIEPQSVVQAVGGDVERVGGESDRTLYRVVPNPGVSRLTLDARTSGEGPSRASTSIQVLAPPPGPAEAQVPAPPLGRELELGAAAGFFWAGAQNIGPAFAATLSVAPWRIPLFLEAEVGVRAAWFSSNVAGLGTLSSTLVVFPIEVAVRGSVWTSGRWRLGLRIGGGLLVGTDWVSSDFGQASSTAATGWELFGAAQVSYRAGSLLPYLEVRGAYAVVTGTGLTANPGGLVMLLGIHWREDLR